MITPCEETAGSVVGESFKKLDIGKSEGPDDRHKNTLKN